MIFLALSIFLTIVPAAVLALLVAGYVCFHRWMMGR